MNLSAFSKIAKENGLLVVQAHPYRRNITRAPIKYLDGIEVHNGCVRHNSRNEKAMARADKYGVIKTSGSDYHQVEDVAHGGIVTTTEIKSNTELLRILKSGSYELIL